MEQVVQEERVSRWHFLAFFFADAVSFLRVLEVLIGLCGGEKMLSAGRCYWTAASWEHLVV